MKYAIHKLTYSDGRAYRYHVSNMAGHLCYVAEHTSMLLPCPPRLIKFFDPDQNPVGRLQPPDVLSWQHETRYELFVGETAEKPRAVIQEQWRPVDILLLQLPHYELQLGKYRYVARGSRYGIHFYEIFRPHGKENSDEKRAGKETEKNAEMEAKEKGPRPKEVKVGEIQCPTSGPSYILETNAAPLRQAPLVLAALVILIDIELHS
jgi:hypothetical protein